MNQNDWRARRQVRPPREMNIRGSEFPSMERIPTRAELKKRYMQRCPEHQQDLEFVVEV